MRTGNSVATITLSLLLAMTPLTNAVAIEAGDIKDENAHKHMKQLVSQTHSELGRVISGLKRFYASNAGAWPSDLASISAFYSGDFQTPYGDITGAQTMNGYSVSISTSDLDDKTLASLATMASKNNGTLVGETLTFAVSASMNVEFVNKALGRYDDPTGEQNTMYTDLDMNNFDLNNVNQIKSQSASIDSATVSTATITSANITNAVVQNANSTNANIATQNAQNASLNNASVTNAVVNGALGTNQLNINGQVKAGGALVLNNTGKLYYQGQDTDTRYLGINETAVDTQRLGGVDASSFALSGSANQFTAHQYFNADATASNINAQTLNTSGTATTNSDIFADQLYLSNAKVGDEWASNTINRVTQNKIDLSYLKSKVSSLHRIGYWRKIRYVKGGWNTQSINYGITHGAMCIHYGRTFTHRVIEKEYRCSGGGGNGKGDGEEHCRYVDVTRYIQFKCQ